jgi:acyl-ACP thioesterase
MGVDRWSLLKKSNAFWVTTKVKLKINRMPALDEKFAMQTWPLQSTAVKFERDAKICAGKETLVAIKSEWVALDADTHKIRPAKSIYFPKMKNRTDRAIEGKFANLNFDNNGAQKVYSRTILPTDIDVNGHTNNCNYTRFVLDCFPLAEHKTTQIDTYEIHFVNESHEGDTLDFYRQDQDNSTLIVARSADKIIVEALICYKK